MKNKVMGQTGRTVLSDDMIQFKREKKRTVRYRYQKVPCGFIAEVIGPFHSTFYGTLSFATKKYRAKAALKRRLGNQFGYIGTMLYSDVDEADNIGNVDLRLLDDEAGERPITKTSSELVGSAGR